MAKETTSQESTNQAQAAQETQQPATPEPAKFEDTISAGEGQVEGESGGFEALFDDEIISDADLRGEEDAEGGEQTGDDQGGKEVKASETKKDDSASSPPKDEEKAKTVEDDQETDDEGDGQTGEEEAKPPKGYVPIQALHQERGQRQILSQQLQQLQQELSDLKAGKTGQEGQTDQQQADEGFKVLSEQEFNELVEEDPVEAIKYDRKLRAHQERQKQQEAAANAEKEAVERSVGMMVEAVPGLYDQDSDVNEQLTNFAIENGFGDVDGLALVTDPKAKVIPPNGGEPRLLGETAANLVLMLNNLFQQRGKANGPDQSKLEKEIEDRLRGEITKEVLGKMKTDTGAGEHKSIGDVPGESGQESTTNLNPTTEADFARLSAEEERRLLGG